MNIKSFLYLCQNIPLDPNYEYTLDFDNLTSQNSYFDSKISNTLAENDDYSYIRKDEEIRVQANVDDLFGVNYLYFINNTKRYYAFITEKRYVSETCTAIKFKIDVMQTFMFDYQLKESFIDREHQDRLYDDSGTFKRIYNTELENVEVGTDYDVKSEDILVDTDKNNSLVLYEPEDLFWYEILTTKPVSDGNFSSSNPSTFVNSRSYLRNKSYNTSVYCYLIPFLEGHPTLTYFSTYNALGQEITLSDRLLSIAKENSACICIRILKYCPVKYTIVKKNTNNYLITFDGGYSNGITATNVADVNIAELNNHNFGGVDLSSNLTKVIAIEHVTSNNSNNDLKFSVYDEAKFNPRNIDANDLPNHTNLKRKIFESKLYTHPYTYNIVSDFQSEPLKIKNEYIPNILKLSIRESLGFLSKYKVCCRDYCNDGGRSYNTINNTLNEIPLITDAYNEYMARNKASATAGVAVNVGGAIANLGLGLATGGLGLAVAGSQAIGIGSQIANHIIKMQDLKETPDSLRQSGNDTEFDLADYNMKYRIRTLQIKNEYLEKLYNYFYHYGYKVNNFKTPNLRSRYYFNYIKTIGANIDSNIDNDYIVELKRIFDDGITIWHYRQDFKGVNNFDYENAEMTMEV